MSLICLCSVFWPSIFFFPSLFFKSSPASGQIGLPAPPACPPPRCSLAHCRLDSSTSHKWYQSRGVSGPAWTSIRVSQSRRWARKRRRVNVPNRCWRRGFVQMLTSAEVMRFVQQDKKIFFTLQKKHSLPPSRSTSSSQSNECGSWAPFIFPSVCCIDMTLCSRQIISCRKHSVLVRARQA